MKSLRKRKRSGEPLPSVKTESMVWRWWKEKEIEKYQEGVKWTALQHNGPAFAPEYQRLPSHVKFYYNGEPMTLSKEAEEVAWFYGKMLKENYAKKKMFNYNFFNDWREVMSPTERELITDFDKCNFQEFYDFYKAESEQRRQKSAEEKERIKTENEAFIKHYGYCIVDGHTQKVINFRLEPPGLFRGRGDHPKMGKLKKRVEAEDIVLNIGSDAEVPQPPEGHQWKDVIHDNKVTWLARWTENISGKLKYIMLNPCSKLKGEQDILKYETARRLEEYIRPIRINYMKELLSKDMTVKQRAVAIYFIDRLALRSGYGKDKETADTVGCCSLRVEHIKLDPSKAIVHFDFPGKDSVRYTSSVEVHDRVFYNIQQFLEGKKRKDLLFDYLKPTVINAYLNDMMEGLTAKVFRTYHASREQEDQLEALTKEEMSLDEKLEVYNLANRCAAIICNHHRAVSKAFSKSMKRLEKKIDEKTAQIKSFKKEAHKATNGKGNGKGNGLHSKLSEKISALEEQLEKLERQAFWKEENKNIALSTSKLNYLDPRITVAWCKKWDVPIEKVYNKTLRERFQWAIETTDSDFQF